MFSRFPLFLVLASDTNTTRAVYLKSVLANNSGAGKDSNMHWLHEVFIMCQLDPDSYHVVITIIQSKP